MTQKSIGYARGGGYAAMRRFVGAGPVVGRGRIAKSGLAAHMHASRKRRGGIPRWFAIAVLAGAFVALAFMNYLSR